MNLSVHEKLSIFLDRLREYERWCKGDPKEVALAVRALALEMVDEFEVAE